MTISILESDYVVTMHNLVMPWFRWKVQTDFLTSYDGTKLRYYYAINEKSKGTIVMVHGFCEFVGKFYEMINIFYKAGYSVFFYEQRGHGDSSRKLTNKSKVHVESYDEYVLDLNAIVNEVVLPNTDDKDNLYLFAHSMGGCVGSLYLERYPDVFKKAVLSSPMLELDFGAPEWMIDQIEKLQNLKGISTTYAPGQHGWKGQYEFEESSCLSQERYDHIFMERAKNENYQCFGGTMAWAIASSLAMKEALTNAEKVEIPVLLCKAGMDTTVEENGQNIFIAKSKNTKCILYSESKHEIYNATDEIREKYYNDLFNFLEK